MNSSAILRSLLIILLLVSVSARAQEMQMLDYAQAQTAVLDPVQWDTVLPNERYFDAVRPLLVRFPGLADTLHAQLAQGYAVEKAELVLEWAKQEGARPERGRSGWGAEELYTNNPGQWHVLARALRHPWSVDVPELGPTFTAYIQGLGFWTQGGARADGTDRFATVFGPTPLFPPLKATTPAPAEPEAEAEAGPAPLMPSALVAKVDVTSTLTDPAYGRTLGERLRALDACGFQLHKQEIRDMKYRSFYAYDWSVGIGYMRIWVKSPRLLVTLKKGPTPVKVDPLPPAVDIPTLAQALKAKGGDGTPTIRVPENLAQLAAQHLKRPEGLPDWAWERIQELRTLGADPNDVGLGLGRGFNYSVLFANDPAAYRAAMRELLRMPPRHWQGHPSSDFAILPVAYGDLLPPAVLDHLKLYWTAWLHPETENRRDIGGGEQRGGPSYFRGYSDGGGTMNFGHNATMGALLGSQLIQAPFPLKDAQRGVEHLQRGWGLGSGAHQEIGDTYYQAITLSSTGAIEKYATDPVDGLLGRVHRDRLLEPLISMYHPGLRRMTHPMGRGTPDYHILLQEGPYEILHTLSPSGTLIHLTDLKSARIGTPSTWGKVHGLSILGDEAPPQRIGLLAPWTEPYLTETMGALVDQKALPSRVYARDYSPGCNGGGWHVNYLGHHYALASRDNANKNYGVTSVVAQWRRAPAQVTAVDDLTTVIMNFGRDGHFPDFDGNVGDYGIVHKDNKLVALKGLPDRDVIDNKKRTFNALHTSLAFLSFGDVSRREVWVNDKKVDAVSGAKPDPTGDWQKRMVTGTIVAPIPEPEDPDAEESEKPTTPPELAANPNRGVVSAKDGDIITISDGVTYAGIIPITLNALARDKQVEIAYEYPTLFIHAFIYRGVKPLNLDQYYGAKDKATAGYVVELSDATEYPTFAAFRAHMQGVKLSTTWNAQAQTADVAYTSDKDFLEMRYNPARYPAVSRNVNGQWPYLPEGIMRESAWAIQGSTGYLEKQGATLESIPGKHAYLQAVPATDTYIGFNPLPDPMLWSMRVPGGMEITADGKASLLRVVAQPTANKVWIDYAPRLTQTGPEMATALLVTGTKQAPAISINDKPYTAQLATITVGGKMAYVIPLTTAMPSAGDLQARYQQSIDGLIASQVKKDGPKTPATAPK
jgi:hypothetical protein